MQENRLTFVVQYCHFLIHNTFIHLVGGSPRSREALKPRDEGLDFSYRTEIWEAPRQYGCWDSCKISVRYDHYYIQSHGVETPWELASQRLINRGPGLFPGNEAIMPMAQCQWRYPK